MRWSNHKIVIGLIIVSGIVLRIVQYLLNRSLWLDESSLALNIILRSYAGLLSPLDYNQVAPVLFLWIVKFFTDVLGPNELGLRLFPLLCSIFSVPLFYLFIRRLFNDTWIETVAVFIFSFSSLFIYYSSEIKQYSSDLFCGLVLCYTFISVVQGSKISRSWFLFGLIGGVSIFLSNISIFFLTLFSTYYIYHLFASRRVEIKKLIFISFWALCFIIYFIFFVANHPHAERMADYWESDFMPLNVFTLQFWQWIFIAAARTFGNLLNFYAYQMQSWWLYLYTLVYFILGVLAIFHLIFRKRWLIVYLLVFPILLHLLTSSIQRYPFNTRLILYLYPMMITLIAYGLKILATKLEALSKFKSLPYLTTALILLVVPVEMLRIYPLEREEIKKSLQYIQDNVSVGQKIYVHSAADRAFEYYEETGFFSVGNEQIRGSVGTYDWSKYNHDINRLSGQVWFLFSHINPYYQAVSAEDYFLANLGKEWSLMDKYKARGSSVYLYERIVQEEIIQYQKKEQ